MAVKKELYGGKLKFIKIHVRLDEFYSRLAYHKSKGG